MRRACWIVSCLALLCTGIFPAYSKSVEEPVSAIKLKVVSVVSQEEIETEIVSSNSGSVAGANFGLFGALIGTSIDAGKNKERTEDAEKAVAKYRDMLVGFDFRSIIHKDLEEAIRQSRVYEITEYTPSSDIKDLEQKPASAKSSDAGGQALLLLDSKYSFDPDFNVIHVRTYGKLFTVKPGSKKHEKKKFTVIYQTEDRKVDYLQSNEESKARELEDIKAKYDALISEEKKREQRYKMELSKDLKSAKRAGYIKLLESQNRDDWDANNIKAELERGMSLVAENLLPALERSIDKKAMKDRLKKIAIIPSGILVAKPSSFKVYDLTGADDAMRMYYLSSFSFDSNVFYLISGEEVPRYPN